MEVEVSAEKIPVYVKAGSVIPMKPVFRSTEEYPLKNLEFHYYPAEGSHTFSIYEDDGLTAQAQNSGANELIRIHARTNNNAHVLRLGSNGKKYLGKPSVRAVKWVVYGQNTKPARILLNDKDLLEWRYENSTGETLIRNWKDESMKLIIE